MIISEIRRVDRTGNVRIPLRFRNELGIRYGDYLEVVLENGQGEGKKVLLLRPVRSGI